MYSSGSNHDREHCESAQLIVLPRCGVGLVLYPASCFLFLVSCFLSPASCIPLMAFDPSNDRWTFPCDLCGSLVGKVLQLPIAVPARRCGSCGLVTLEQALPINGGARVTSLRSS